MGLKSRMSEARARLPGVSDEGEGSKPGAKAGGGGEDATQQFSVDRQEICQDDVPEHERTSLAEDSATASLLPFSIDCCLVT